MDRKPKLKAAILIVSDTVSQDLSADRAESALKAVFNDDGGDQWDVSAVEAVPDDFLGIQRSVRQWTDGGDPMSLIITTGGTGFAERDRTPEAISPLIHRQAPGIVHGMLAASLAITPFAVMSRPVAGVRHKTVILTLPGSPKGAAENLQAVIKLLPHACTQAAGQDSRSVHQGGVKQLERDAGVGPCTPVQHGNHQHHHHHSHAHSDQVPVPLTPQSNDPSSGPTHRHRSSPYPIISVSEATSIIFAHTPSPRPVTVPTADATSLLGYVIAADITAPQPVPAFRASIVDGYALVAPTPTAAQPAPTTKGTFPVVSVSHATTSGNAPKPLLPGQLARITTGAPLPPGANAVVMVEDTVLASTTPCGAEEKEVTILAPHIPPSTNVRAVGCDVAQHATVLTAGTAITPVGGELGLLCSLGIASLAVYARPSVAVLSTGDELVAHASPPPTPPGAVRDTNRPALLAALAAAGFPAHDLGIAPDAPHALEATLRAAVVKHDVLITTGGVSMGELDLLKPVLERRLGGTVHFGRVAMKPGKPTTFATVPGAAEGPRPHEQTRQHTKQVFALPGNPASALVTFHLLVLPALRLAAGVARNRASLPRVRVKMDGAVRRDASRREYHRVVVFFKDGLWARSTGGQRSSRVGSLSGGNGLLVVEPVAGRETGEGGRRRDTVWEGEEVECLLLGPVVGF